MSPVIVRVRLIAPADEGIGRVVVVVVGGRRGLECGDLPSVEIAFAELSEPPAPNHAKEGERRSKEGVVLGGVEPGAFTTPAQGKEAAPAGAEACPA